MSLVDKVSQLLPNSDANELKVLVSNLVSNNPNGMNDSTNECLANSSENSVPTSPVRSAALAQNSQSETHFVGHIESSLQESNTKIDQHPHVPETFRTVFLETYIIEGLLYVTIRVNGTSYYQALIDTASTCTLISKKVAQDYPIHIARNVKVHLRSLSREKIKTQGIINLMFNLELHTSSRQQDLVHTCVAVEDDLPYDVVLGFDFLCRFKSFAFFHFNRLLVLNAKIPSWLNAKKQPLPEGWEKEYSPFSCAERENVDDSAIVYDIDGGTSVRKQVLIVEADIGGSNGKVAVDTCSAVTLVSPNFAAHFQPKDPGNVWLRSLGEQLTRPIAKIDLKIKLGGLSLVYEAFVVEHLKWAALLGYDFLDEFKLKADFEIHSLSFKNNDGLRSDEIAFVRQKCKSLLSPDFDLPENDINAISIDDSEENIVPVYLCLQHDYVLEPRTHRKVSVVSSNGLPIKHSVVEPLEELEKKKQVVSPTAIVHSEDSETDVWLTNPTDKEIKVFANTKVAEVTDEVEVVEIPNKDVLKWREDGTAYLDPDLLEKVRKLRRDQFDENDVKLGSHLTPGQRKRAMRLIRKYSDVFAKSLETVGKLPRFVASVKLKDGSHPVFQYPFKSSLEQKKVIDGQVDEMVKFGIAEEGISDYLSPVLLVKKANGDWRLCISYVRLNKIVVQDRITIPQVAELIETLSQGHKYFTSLDCFSFYWEVPISPESRRVLAFGTHSRTLLPNFLQFGLCTAVSIGQRVAYSIFGSLLHSNVVVYLDDVCAFAEDFEKKLVVLEKIFQRAREENLTFKIDKCSFFQEEVRYMGYIIGQDGLKFDSAKVEALKDLPRPKNQKQVRSLLGSLTYYRRFVPGFSMKTKVLSDLTKKEFDGKPINWTPECEEAYQNILKIYCEHPVLSHFRSNDEIQIYCDSSDIGHGACLEQKDENGKRHVIAYASRLLSPGEKKMISMLHEAHAVLFALSKFRNYVNSSVKTTVFSDNKNVTYLFNSLDKPSHDSKLSRLQMKLLEFDNVEVKHVAGVDNAMADLLSRNIPDDRVCSDKDLEALEVPSFEVSLVDYGQDQLADDDLRPLKSYLENGNSNVSSAFERRAKQFILRDDILYYKNSKPGRLHLLCVPKNRRGEILQEYHESLLSGGHLGEAKLYQKLSERFYWSTLRRDCIRYCKTCELCSARKGLHSKKMGFLQPLSIPGEPFERCHVDCLGPFNKDEFGNIHIIALVCGLTKFVILKAIPDATAETVTQFILDVCLQFSCPKLIVTDRGTQFTSNTFEAALKMLNAKHNLTTSYHPQSNGQVERINAVIAQTLSMYAMDTHQDWSLYVPFCQHLINTSFQESVQSTPFELLFGYKPRLPFDNIFYPELRDVSRSEQLQVLVKMRDLAKERIASVQEKMKERIDPKRREPSFKIGDLVRIKSEARKVGVTQKLRRTWLGVYKIVNGTPNPNVFKVELVTKGPRGKTKKADTVNVDKMKKVHIRKADEFV